MALAWVEIARDWEQKTKTKEYELQGTDDTSPPLDTVPPLAPDNPVPSSQTFIPLAPETLGCDAGGGLAHPPHITDWDIYFGIDAVPPLVVSHLAADPTNNTGQYWAPPSLTGGTIYYWRFVARNAAGATSGPVWSFRAAG